MGGTTLLLVDHFPCDPPRDRDLTDFLNGQMVDQEDLRLRTRLSNPSANLGMITILAILILLTTQDQAQGHGHGLDHYRTLHFALLAPLIAKMIALLIGDARQWVIDATVAAVYLWRIKGMKQRLSV